MAWVLGVLCSIGHLVARSSTILWTATNAELMVKIRACLDSTHPIHTAQRGQQRQPMRILAVGRKRMRADIDELIPIRLHLERRGLPKVPQELLSHFLRGYFEGDGRLLFDESKGRFIMKVSGNTALIEDMCSRLLGASLDVPGSLSRQRKAKDCVRMQMSQRMAFRFADFLYRDSSDAQRLESNWVIYERYRQWRAQHGLDASHVG